MDKLFFTDRDMELFRMYEGTIEAFCKDNRLTRVDDAVSMGIIVDTVRDYFEMSLGELFVKSTNNETSIQRQLVHYFGYYYSRLTLKSIATSTNQKNSDAVSYSTKQINNHLDVDKRIPLIVTAIDRLLKEKGVKRQYTRKFGRK